MALDLEDKYQPFLIMTYVDFYGERRRVRGRCGHIFTDPFYYIDYCLAQIVSLEIWDMSRKNPKAALRVYDQLCMEGGNGTFLELIEKGLGFRRFHRMCSKGSHIRHAISWIYDPAGSVRETHERIF